MAYVKVIKFYDSWSPTIYKLMFKIFNFLIFLMASSMTACH